MLQFRWIPSPCNRLSRSRTTTNPPPHFENINWQRAFPFGQVAPGRRGIFEMVPTFTVEPFDRLGAQLCPCDIVTITPQLFIVTSRSAIPTDKGVPCTLCKCASQPNPYLPTLSWSECFRNFKTLVSHVRLSVLLTGPSPFGSAGLFRRCRGCLPAELFVPTSQPAPSFINLLRQVDSGAFHHRTVQ